MKRRMIRACCEWRKPGKAMFSAILAGFMAVGAGFIAYGQDVTIVKAGGGKLSIDISGFKGGGGKKDTFCSVLASDLKRSGYFDVVQQQGKAVIVADGECDEGSDSFSVECETRNGVTSKRYFNKDFSEKGQNAAARVAHAVADEIVWAVKNVKGIASTKIAMIGSKGRVKDLYVSDIDGGNLTRVTQDGMAYPAPSWGGSQDVLFYTSRHGGFPDIYSIDLHTKNRRSFSSYPGLNAGADVSVDGRKMALTLSKDGNPELYIMDLSSKRLTRVTRTEYAAEASPSWSPDGGRIVFVSDKSGSPQLYIMSSSGGEQKFVSSRGSENVAPDWGPSGRIAWSSKRGARYEICVWDPSTGQNVQITAGDADYEDPSWAPDGRHIACSRTVGYTSDIYILDTMGDAPIRLTRVQGDWYSPCWSP